MLKPAIAASAAVVTLLVASSARAEDGDWPVVPVFRMALGPAIHVAPDRDKAVELGLDVTAGAITMPGDDFVGFVINPELGYAFDGIGVHAFNLTCGIGIGTPIAALLYHPRLIAGTGDGEPAIGMRNSLTFHALADMGSLELGHQFVHLNGELHHDIRVMFGVNPAAFFFIVSGISNALR